MTIFNIYLMLSFSVNRNSPRRVKQKYCSFHQQELPEIDFFRQIHSQKEFLEARDGKHRRRTNFLPAGTPKMPRNRPICDGMRHGGCESQTTSCTENNSLVRVNPSTQMWLLVQHRAPAGFGAEPQFPAYMIQSSQPVWSGVEYSNFSVSSLAGGL